MGGVSGDFGLLTATINSLANLSSVPSQVASIAAPQLTEQAQSDAYAERNPYGDAFAPHTPATIKRWGPHPILNLTGRGIDSIKAAPSGGAGIVVTADEHLRFAQGGTVNEPVRAVLPNNPTLPRSWRAILERATNDVLERRLARAGR